MSAPGRGEEWFEAAQNRLATAARMSRSLARSGRIGLVDFIYHIARAADWEQATRDGEYTVSTAGRTLAEEGFIHASQSHQVQGVKDAFFQDVPDLVLLVIDPALVRAPVQYDAVPGVADPFPHIYGPLNTNAVVEVRAL